MHGEQRSLSQSPPEGGCDQVTADRRAEEVLRAERANLNAVFEASPICMLVLDEGLEVVKANAAAVALCGGKISDVLHHQPGEALHCVESKKNLGGCGHAEACQICPVRRSITALFASGGGLHGAEVALDLQTYGSPRKVWVRIGVEPVMIDERRHLCVALEDVTERKQAEEERLQMQVQLQQGQRLQAVGTLASGVAHEINNPLSVVMNYAQLILDDARPDDPSRELAATIVSECERIAEIVRNLLSFSRCDRETHSPADVKTLVDSTLSLVRTSLRKDQIALTAQIQEGLPKIRCRSQQIQQVLMNLLTNARDAVNEAGSQTGKRLGVTARLLEINGQDWLRLTVEDNGPGIAPDIAERVFDPFFTTKPRDRGTGLGLSISYGIVKDHGGSLWFESQPGSGTRFHVDLKVDNGWSRATALTTETAGGV